MHFFSFIDFLPNFVVLKEHWALPFYFMLTITYNVWVVYLLYRHMGHFSPNTSIRTVSELYPRVLFLYIWRVVHTCRCFFGSSTTTFFVLNGAKFKVRKRSRLDQQQVDPEKKKFIIDADGNVLLTRKNFRLAREVRAERVQALPWKEKYWSSVGFNKQPRRLRLRQSSTELTRNLTRDGKYEITNPSVRPYPHQIRFLIQRVTDTYFQKGKSWAKNYEKYGRQKATMNMNKFGGRYDYQYVQYYDGAQVDHQNAITSTLVTRNALHRVRIEFDRFFNELIKDRAWKLRKKKLYNGRIAHRVSHYDKHTLDYLSVRWKDDRGKNLTWGKGITRRVTTPSVNRALDTYHNKQRLPLGSAFGRVESVEYIAHSSNSPVERRDDVVMVLLDRIHSAAKAYERLEVQKSLHPNSPAYISILKRYGQKYNELTYIYKGYVRNLGGLTESKRRPLYVVEYFTMPTWFMIVICAFSIICLVLGLALRYFTRYNRLGHIYKAIFEKRVRELLRRSFDWHRAYEACIAQEDQDITFLSESERAVAAALREIDKDKDNPEEVEWIEEYYLGDKQAMKEDHKEVELLGNANLIPVGLENKASFIRYFIHPAFVIEIEDDFPFDPHVFQTILRETEIDFVLENPTWFEKHGPRLLVRGFQVLRLQLEMLITRYWVTYQGPGVITQERLVRLAERYKEILEEEEWEEDVLVWDAEDITDPEVRQALEKRYDERELKTRRKKEREYNKIIYKTDAELAQIIFTQHIRLQDVGYTTKLKEEKEKQKK